MEIISKKSAKLLGLAKYFTGKLCLNNHISERSIATGHCCECERERTKARRDADPEKFRERVRLSQARHAEKNREKRRDQCRAWYQKNRVKVLEAGRREYAANPQFWREKERLRRDSNSEKLREDARRRRVLNNEKINAKQRAARALNPLRYKNYHQQWMVVNRDRFNTERRERLASDPIYSFISRARNLIRGAIRRAGFTKAKKTEQLLGCSMEEFRRQIERQFLPGMGWHNMSLWHIDHIVPVSFARSLAEAEILNQAGNLRPLWAIDNRKKLAKVSHLL